MKRCIINVGVGQWYPRGQQRLRESMARFAPGVDFLAWTNRWPPGSPSHAAQPFAFKAWAFRHAVAEGYDQVLWLDCSCWLVAPVDPIFDHIGRHGYVFSNNGWHLGQWASDHCLQRFGLTRDQAMGMLDLTAMFMGLDLRNPKAQAWLQEFCACCEDPALMNGSLHNRPGQVIIDPHSGYNCGVISADPRCLGHSREQVVAGILAHKHGLVPYVDPPLFLVQGLAPDKVPPAECIVQACGM